MSEAPLRAGQPASSRSISARSCSAPPSSPKSSSPRRAPSRRDAAAASPTCWSRRPGQRRRGARRRWRPSSACRSARRSRPSDVDQSAGRAVPIGFAKTHGILPLQRDPDGAVRVAVANPLDIDPLDDLRMLFDGAEVRLELANQRTILGAINEVYDRGAELHRRARRGRRRGPRPPGRARSARSPRTCSTPPTTRPIIQLVNSLLQHAVKERASDIHLEPFEREIRVRFRIDDVLYEPIKPLPARAPGEHRLAHQDHGRPQHRREAPAPGRPHPAQDRRARLRRAPLDRARSRTASAW